MENIKVVVITGASKGIGLEAAKKFNKKGYIVYDLSKSGVNTDIVRHIDCDVSKSDMVKSAIKRISEECGRIDVAVSNAGFGISGSLEGNSYNHIESQIDVNFKGAAYFTKAVLEHIRASKGRIIYLSSIAAVVPIPFQALYSASKAAIVNMAMAVDNEIRPSGARALVLLPGDVATNFTKSRVKNNFEPDFYSNRAKKSVGKMEKDEINGMKPELIAEKILKLAENAKAKQISSVGAFYNFVLRISGILPLRLKQYIIYKMYGK